MRWVAPALFCAALAAASAAWAREPAPLQLEAKIPLGRVKGRIDHFAAASARRRLFVAELGNDTVGVVDLKAARMLRTLDGLREPQGIGYEPSTDMLYVANGGDGSVRLFRGGDLSPAGRIELGEDADNVRVDAATSRVYVGHGGGALAVIDATRRAMLADIPLQAHPESFQIDPASGHLFVNLPEADQIAVIDRGTGRQIAAWSLPGARANFPMALDPDGDRVVVAFRNPARLVAFRAQDGRPAAALDTCGDADDVFVDERRQRVYVSCGDGAVDVLARQGDRYGRVARVPTVAGARTSLFLPETDRLYVGVRAAGAEPAAVWVFRPAP